MNIALRSKARWLGGTALAGVPGALLVAGLTASAAHAVPTYAYSNLTFSNLALSGVPTADITSSSVVIDDKSAFLGFASDGHTSSNGNLTNGATTSQAYSGPGPVPAASSHVNGPPFVAASGFGQEMTTSTGARAFVDISGAITGPASSQEVSEGHLTSPGTGSSNTDSTTSIHVNFTALAHEKVTLSFDYSVQQIAKIGSNGDVANVGDTSAYQILNGPGNVVYDAKTDFTPGGLANTVIVDTVLNHNINDNFGAPNTETFTRTGHLNLVYTTTKAGNFTLNIDSGTNEQIIGTPEPASLALIGTGLLGVGMVRRRRRKV